MNAYMMVIAVLLPMFGSILIPLLPFRKRNVMAFYIELLVLVTSALTFGLIMNPPSDALSLIHI